ncbi:MAG: hypothetical protein FK730_14640 [Asgard group archaeon]|nr:hypothetical protein [Asgard group archaeon]
MDKKVHIFLISMLLVIGFIPITFICGEYTPPVVNITSHTSNQNVSGSITITATATDSGSGVWFVQFYFGGELISTDYSAPYTSDSITVKYWAEGSQTILVCATDYDTNFAVDSVNVNVVIDYEEESDWDSHETWDNYDSVWYPFRTFDMTFYDSKVYIIDDWVRKVEFDWYSNDAYKSYIECKWAVYDEWRILNPEVGTLNTPGTDPTHVTLIFNPEEVPYGYGLWLTVRVNMYRYGNWILEVGHSHIP